MRYSARPAAVRTGTTAPVAAKHGVARRDLERVAVLAILVVAAAIRLPNLDEPLLEMQGFRQTQTAYTALIFHDEGIDLLHPKLPVLGEPFEVPFEFPLFQAIASILMDLGTPPDMAMRLIGLTFFLLTALLLYGLVRRIAGRPAAFGSLLAFTASPFGIVWGRTSMIEYLATAGAVGFAWAAISWQEKKRVVLGFVALASCAIALLVKVTTGIFWLLPVLAYEPPRRRAGIGFVRARLPVAAITIIPVALTIAWTRHADGIKAENPATAILTSEALTSFNFGSLHQRLDPSTWETIIVRVSDYITGPALMVIPFTLLAIWESRQRLFWIGILAAAGLPALVFTNLYWEHDYYLAAITPAVAALLGLGGAWIWERIPKRNYVLVPAIASLTLVVLLTFIDTRHYWKVVYQRGNDPSRVLPIAAEVEENTRPDDLVAIGGFFKWSPEILYYARRRGHMLRSLEPPPYFLRESGYRFFVSYAPEKDQIWFLHAWPWIGVVGKHLYQLGEKPSDLDRAKVLAAEEASPAGKNETGRPLLRERLTVTCGREAVDVRPGRTGTWLKIVWDPSAKARLWLVDGTAPLPVRSIAIVRPEALPAGVPLRVRCEGTKSIVLAEITDAPPPL
jgi:hypothetical protein